MRFILPMIVMAGAAQAETLTVYTYDSFVTDWGPGPAVETAFEAVCDCDLEFVAAGDGAALLARLNLEGERTQADVVLGLDSNLIAEARATGMFAESGVAADYDLPIAWDDATFVPYDWGYFAFVHEVGFEAPASFAEMAESDASIIVQDPRSSTPGLGLMLWVDEAYGAEAGAIWEGLSDNIVTVTAGWSEAYGLFLEGEADMVLSYTTSPAYHLIAENDPTKTAALFEEGHYLQVEVAAKLAGTDVPELADRFMAFVVEAEFQGVIPTTNWMYPAIDPDGGLPDGFDGLPRPERALLIDPEQVPERKAAALEVWRTALSR